MNSSTQGGVSTHRISVNYHNQSQMQNQQQAVKVSYNRNNSHIEDKENKRETANKQPTQSNSSANLLKRSKTTDPTRAPLRQKESQNVNNNVVTEPQVMPR